MPAGVLQEQPAGPSSAPSAAGSTRRPRAPRHHRPEVERLAREAIATLSLVAGAIHLAVTREHFAEDMLFGVFFLVLGLWQVGWALLVTGRRSRIVDLGGAAINGAVIALWVVSRTVGIPLGPHPWQPETIGAMDTLSSLTEALIVYGCLVLAGTSAVGARMASRTVNGGEWSDRFRSTRALTAGVALVTVVLITAVGMRQHGGRQEMGMAAPVAGPGQGVPVAMSTVFQTLTGAKGITLSGGSCWLLVDQGWTGFCREVTMGGGRTASVVQRDARSGDVVARVYTYDGGQDAWIPRLEARGFHGATLASVVIVPADLTDDGAPELLVGFHLHGSEDDLTYEVVTSGPGSPPEVILHSELDQGAVVIRGSIIHAYSARPGAGAATSFAHDKFMWDGTALQSQDLGEVPPERVPDSQL